MELVFLRHGLAVDREEWKGEDEARPLTAEGVERTKEVVRGLRALKGCPDVILSSALLRARETAEIAKKGLSSDAKVELADELTPSAAPDRLIARLADGIPGPPSSSRSGTPGSCSWPDGGTGPGRSNRRGCVGAV